MKALKSISNLWRICLDGRLIMMAVFVSAVATPSYGAGQVSAMELAQQIVNRSANESRVGNMHFSLHNDSGSVRKRSALFVHSALQGDTKIGIYFTSPAALQNTGFLSYDSVAGHDQNWLYLPATERVRKLPASSKGDYFMGTDLTYGDIKDNFKFALDDWTFSLSERQVIDGKTYYTLQGQARNQNKKHELGYSGFIARVDPDTYFPLKIAYTDIDGAPLKTISVLRLEKIQGAWIATHFAVHNTQNAHKTDVLLSDVKHVPELPPEILTADELGYGVPSLTGF